MQPRKEDQKYERSRYRCDFMDGVDRVQGRSDGFETKRNREKRSRSWKSPSEAEAIVSRRTIASCPIRHGPSKRHQGRVRIFSATPGCPRGIRCLRRLARRAPSDCEDDGVASRAFDHFASDPSNKRPLKLGATAEMSHRRSASETQAGRGFMRGRRGAQLSLENRTSGYEEYFSQDSLDFSMADVSFRSQDCCEAELNEVGVGEKRSENLTEAISRASVEGCSSARGKIREDNIPEARRDVTRNLESHKKGCETTQPPMDAKKMKRVLANRQSAARSKEKKILYLRDLETKFKSLQETCSKTAMVLSNLESDIVRCNSENRKLTQCLEESRVALQLRRSLARELLDEVDTLTVSPSQRFAENYPLNTEGVDALASDQERKEAE